MCKIILLFWLPLSSYIIIYYSIVYLLFCCTASPLLSSAIYLQIVEVVWAVPTGVLVGYISCASAVRRDMCPKYDTVITVAPDITVYNGIDDNFTNS
jgi:hypothetical protein